jgi:hypothetical protein
MKYFCLFLINCALGLQLKGADETTLTDANSDLLLAPESKWMVMFYNNDCPHCQTNRLIWTDFFANTTHSTNGVTIGAVDCCNNADLCERYPRDSCPGILSFATDSHGKTTIQECYYTDDFSDDSLTECLDELQEA